MKACKVLSCLLVLVLLLSAVLPMEAGAIDLIDFDKYQGNGAFTVVAQYGQGTDAKNMTGMKFKIYLVATPNENSEFTTILSPFDQFCKGFDLNNLDQAKWSELAGVLAGKVKAYNESSPETPLKTAGEGEIRTDGTYSFRDLQLGLYLVVGEDLFDEDTKITYRYPAALVTVPTRNQDSQGGTVDIDTWNYGYGDNNGDGKRDVIYVSGKIVTPKTDVKVIKHWEDKNNAAKKRPLKLKVQLYDGETPYGEPVYLTADNNWTYEWRDLPIGDWKVAEDTTGLDKLNYKPGTPYRDDMGTKFIVWHIKNTYSPPTPPKLPQTGQLWWPVPVLLSAGLLCMLVALIRRKGEKDEA